MLCYAKSLQSCPTLWDPIDSSSSGSPVPGILQARTLEWVAISFSSAWKWKVKVKSLSRVRLLGTPWTAAYKAPPSVDFPGKSTGVGCHCLLWYIIYIYICSVTQSCLTLCLVDCSPPGSSVHGISQARILEWVAISSCRGFSWPRDQTRISCVSWIGGRILYH